MIRRRRPVRETAFSFDSFLDLVTNIVGIIIRLILVVWVGAQSYNALPDVLKSRQAALPKPAAEPPPITDPLEAELARQRAELAEAERRMLEQLRQLELERGKEARAGQELAEVEARRDGLRRDLARLDEDKADPARSQQEVTHSLAELQKRREALAAELKALEKLPPLKKTLHYRTPVSQPVDAEEWHFECKDGRVTFINIAAFVALIKRDLDENSKALENRWSYQDATETVGDFRMNYTLERGRTAMDQAFGATAPGGGGFRIGVSWQLEPVVPDRGETVEAALQPGSAFRRVVDGLPRDSSAVTFWVYPDSFTLYRQLRDFLADRDITVAGRPLPFGFPISSSPSGTASRGQ
jgi:hypothetical protein